MRKTGTDISVGPIAKGQGIIVSNKKKYLQTRYKEEPFTNEGGKTLKQVTGRGGRCLISGNIQDQAVWGSNLSDVVEDIPAHCSGVGLDDL